MKKPPAIGSWEEDREHKYLVGTTVSVDERLAWVEEMLEIAYAAGAIPKPRDAWGQPIEPGAQRDGDGGESSSSRRTR